MVAYDHLWRGIGNKIGNFRLCVGRIQGHIHAAHLNGSSIQGQCISQFRGLHDDPISRFNTARSEDMSHLSRTRHKVSEADLGAVVTNEENLVSIRVDCEECIVESVRHATFPFSNVSIGVEAKASTLRVAAIRPLSAKSSWYCSVLVRSYL